MNHATFTFDQDLRFFLSRQQKQQDVVRHAFDWRGSVKDMIESLGVPHTEIYLILVNNQPVQFDYIVEPDGQIEVYGLDYPKDRSNGVQLRPLYEGRPRFVLDTHLGRLAAYLRMLGYDTLYRNDYPDDELAEVSHHEQRILLTRDVGLLKRSLVVYGYYVRTIKPQQRLMEIADRYDLRDDIKPFKHCMKCNGLLHSVAKDQIADQLPPGTASYYQRFHQCMACGQVYWKGAHYQRMQQLLDTLLQSP